MKILPVGAELFFADGQTDMTKLMVAFCNFANAPKNNKYIIFWLGIFRTEEGAELQIIIKQLPIPTTYICKCGFS
jgi:hypothetical protein